MYYNNDQQWSIKGSVRIRRESTGMRLREVDEPGLWHVPWWGIMRPVDSIECGLRLRGWPWTNYTCIRPSNEFWIDSISRRMGKDLILGRRYLWLSKLWMTLMWLMSTCLWMWQPTYAALKLFPQLTQRKSVSFLCSIGYDRHRVWNT